MEAILAPKGPLMFKTFFSGRTISRKDPLCLSIEVPDLEATENRPVHTSAFCGARVVQEQSKRKQRNAKKLILRIWHL